MTAVEKLINIAANEIGYLEKNSNSNLYDKTANAGRNNYTKYWAEIKPEFQGQPWCACFVTWCMKQAFGIENATTLLGHYPFVYVPKLANLFTRYSTPMVGDIVCFYNNGELAHTGIVTGVNGDYFTTIEGNTSGGSTIIANGGGVCKKGYYTSKLAGTKFIRPNYTLVENVPKKFVDVAGHYAEKHIDKLSFYGVVSGYEDGSFKPDNNITRAEFATMVTASLEKACGYNLKNSATFPDIGGHWAENQIKKLVSCGIANGFEDCTFKPELEITRGQAAIIACNTLLYAGKEMIDGNSFPDTSGHYAERHIRCLSAYGVVNGCEDGTFRPDEPITRGQAAIIVANVLTILGK